MSTNRVLIYGGKGALGSKCVSTFKNYNWWVISVATQENEEADLNIIVDKNEKVTLQEQKVLETIGESLKEEKLDAIVCVAGGWIGGNAKSELVKKCESMWEKSLNPSLISASVATKYLKEGGLLSFTGAKSALNPTPTMLSYGISKSAVHFLTKSLSNAKSGLPKDVVTVAILPSSLDTPMNRKSMPNADYSTWTPLEFVAELFLKWSTGKELPASGSLLELVTKNFNTDIVTV